MSHATAMSKFLANRLARLHQLILVSLALSLGEAVAATALQPALLGSWPGHCASGIAVRGRYAYVAAQAEGFFVVDISNPASPQEVGVTNIGPDAEQLALSGNYAFVASGGAGLKVVDITDPFRPRLAGYCATDDHAYSVALAGNLACVADYTGGLQVIDISDPTTPHRLGRYMPGGDAYGVAATNQYAYLAVQYVGLMIIDLTNPTTPQLLTNYNNNFARGTVSVLVAGHYAYLAADEGLEILDITAPASPQRLGGNSLDGLFEMGAVQGDYLFAADDDIGMMIIDIRDPHNPVLAGGYDTREEGYCATVIGPYAYYGDTDGLHVVLPDSRVHLTPLRDVLPAGFWFGVEGWPGSRVTIQKSSDLVHWEDWALVTLQQPAVVIGQPGITSQPRQFFRTFRR